MRWKVQKEVITTITIDTFSRYYTVYDGDARNCLLLVICRMNSLNVAGAQPCLETDGRFRLTTKKLPG